MFDDASSSGEPDVGQYVSAAHMWLERKPQDFIRAFRKSQSESALMPPPSSGAPKKKGRKSTLNPSTIIAAQQAKDDAKKVKDLEAPGDEERVLAPT